MSLPLSSAQEARTALAVRLRRLRLDAGLTGAVLSARCGLVCLVGADCDDGVELGVISVELTGTASMVTGPELVLP
ncbi:hypothetical protein [Streptomyces sp. NPDC059761]|uniref:hypothetical protein n=1 Tax=Streptomyces sp. NPDC059761 TaxID=3346937 RepID=UPI00364D557C